MALSLTELDQQGAEFLPAREVMSTCGCRRRKHYGGGDWTQDNDGNTFQNDAGGNGFLNILSGNQLSVLNGNFSGAD